MNTEIINNETVNEEINEKDNETINKIDNPDNMNKNVISKIGDVIKNIIINKHLQGAVITLAICSVGIYYYDPIMNWISPPPVVIPEPWYVFWK